MTSVRIAVASTPLTATLDEAIPAAIAAVEEAARLGARIVCLPETGLPGHRGQSRAVPAVSAAALDDAVRQVAGAARRAQVVTIVGVERPTAAGREIRSAVIDADGTILGEQSKTQIDPSEACRTAPSGWSRRMSTSPPRRGASRAAGRRSATSFGDGALGDVPRKAVLGRARRATPPLLARVRGGRRALGRVRHARACRHREVIPGPPRARFRR